MIGHVLCRGCKEFVRELSATMLLARLPLLLSLLWASVNVNPDSLDAPDILGGAVKTSSASSPAPKPILRRRAAPIREPTPTAAPVINASPRCLIEEPSQPKSEVEYRSVWKTIQERYVKGQCDPQLRKQRLEDAGHEDMSVAEMKRRLQHLESVMELNHRVDEEISRAERKVEFSIRTSSLRRYKVNETESLLRRIEQRVITGQLSGEPTGSILKKRERSEDIEGPLRKRARTDQDSSTPVFSSDGEQYRSQSDLETPSLRVEEEIITDRHWRTVPSGHQANANRLVVFPLRPDTTAEDLHRFFMLFGGNSPDTVTNIRMVHEEEVLIEEEEDRSPMASDEDEYGLGAHSVLDDILENPYDPDGNWLVSFDDIPKKPSPAKRPKRTPKRTLVCAFIDFKDWITAWTAVKTIRGRRSAGYTLSDNLVIDWAPAYFDRLERSMVVRRPAFVPSELFQEVIHVGNAIWQQQLLETRVDLLYTDGSKPFFTRHTTNSLAYCRHVNADEAHLTFFSVTDLKIAAETLSAKGFEVHTFLLP